MKKYRPLIIIAAVIALGCSSFLLLFKQERQIDLKPTPLDSPLFVQVSNEHSGIQFQNKIQETNLVNYFKYEYLYNGGGVSIGDVNNDGLPDLYFTGNMTSNRLYLNKGDLQFEDITAKAKASYLNDWCTGVTMVDINHDGWLDIYVSASGYYEDPEVRRNILFVNNGDAAAHHGVPTFTDRAAEYGIDDIGYSIQSVFFDYDNDGDLDLYVANHPNLFREKASVVLEKMKNPPLENSDRLYRNDSENGAIQFTDVSQQAGIINYSHTLGLVVSDFDKDGWMDIYTSNDYQSADYLYRNNGNGTFTNIIDQSMKHMAKFSMGVDANDFNNDGWSDIFAVEMMAEDNKRQKTNMAPMNPQEFENVVNAGFGYQYMHNALQLNNGILDQEGRQSELTFSEISYLSGVATTDWSWSPLFADLDNDGWKDLLVTNGYRRDVLDKDFKKELKELLKDGKTTYEHIKSKIPGSILPNYVFRNNGDLTFSKQSKEWNLGDLVNSNGAAYADLDLDGDLDLVLNNIDTLAFVYKNNSIEYHPEAGNYLRIKLTSDKPNRLGLGAKISITTADGLTQYQELSLTRGYQSSVEPILHFGLGKHNIVQEVQIEWPDQSATVLKAVKANQLLEVSDQDAKVLKKPGESDSKMFQAANAKYDLKHQHQEVISDDYAKQVLLPHKLSQNGPGLAVADVNGDGLDDFYVGGAAGFAGTLHLQNAEGTFSVKNTAAFTAHQAYEDLGVLFFDADQDDDYDLIAISGSYEFEEGSTQLKHRLYLNDGNGNFSYNEKALPELKANSSCVSAGDYDQDGDLDLFIGGRLISGKYPMAPESYLLKNTGGQFENVSSTVDGLAKMGMVTSALWTDYDDDDDLDLICVGEWMPITIFTNTGSSFEKSSIPNSIGWWNSITGGDIDNDGDTDYILGNLGTNSKNKASLDHPFHIYGDDFDDNGNFDIVLGYYYEGVQYPVRGMQCSSEQIPDLKKKITSYNIFGSSTLDEIYGKGNLEQSLHIEATIFESALLLNKGSASFDLQVLPHEAQFAPIKGSIVEDLDRDGCLDILVVGNQYPVEVETGRYDAMKGLLLKGNCEGAFRPVSYAKSGFLVDGDAKALSLIAIGRDNDLAVIATMNQGATKIFDLQNKNGFSVKRAKKDKSILSLANGKQRKQEYYWGTGYLSQHSRVLVE
ncbi:MAG: FG-GAP-like repeat-containing protein [Bacteroidota bacterium]